SPFVDPFEVRQFLERYDIRLPALTKFHAASGQKSRERRCKDVGPHEVDLGPGEWTIRRKRDLKLIVTENYHAPDRRPQDALLMLVAHMPVKIHFAVNPDRFIYPFVFLRQDALIELDRARACQCQLLVFPFPYMQRTSNVDSATDVILVAG